MPASPEYMQFPCYNQIHNTSTYILGTYNYARYVCRTAKPLFTCSTQVLVTALHAAPSSASCP